MTFQKVDAGGKRAIVRLAQIAEFRSCVTCVYRRWYPPSTQNGQQIFSRFFCGMAADTGKAIVKPEDVCDDWKGVALNAE